MSDPFDCEGSCNVCGAEGEIGVFGSSIAPASFAYCRECVERKAEPFMTVATKIFFLGGASSKAISTLADIVTYDEDQYVGLDAVLQSYPDLEDDIRADFFGENDDEPFEKHYFLDLLNNSLENWGFYADVEMDSNFKHKFILNYDIDGLSEYRLHIEACTIADRLRFHLYSPIKIPKKRQAIACVVLNHINHNIQIGSLQTAEGTVRYTYTIDAEGLTVPVDWLSSMRTHMLRMFSPKVAEAIGAIAFTKMPADEIIARFEEAEEEENTAIPLNPKGTGNGLFIAPPKA